MRYNGLSSDRQMLHIRGMIQAYWISVGAGVIRLPHGRI
jgi:hypothetical protein